MAKKVGAGAPAPPGGAPAPPGKRSTSDTVRSYLRWLGCVLFILAGAWVEFGLVAVILVERGILLHRRDGSARPLAPFAICHFHDLARGAFYVMIHNTRGEGQGDPSALSAYSVTDRVRRCAPASFVPRQCTEPRCVADLQPWLQEPGWVLPSPLVSPHKYMHNARARAYTHPAAQAHD